MGISNGSEPPPQVSQSPSPSSPDLDHEGTANPQWQVATERWFRRFLIFFLLLLGALCAVVGLADLIRAYDIAIRLQGAILLLAGAIVVLGALGASAGRDPWPLAAGALSSVMAIVIGLFFWRQVLSNYTDSQPRLVRVRRLSEAVIFVSALSILYFGFRLVQGRKELVKSGKDRWKRLLDSANAATVVAALFGALATVLAALLAFSQFWYSSQYTPSSALPNVTITTQLDHTHAERGLVPVTLRMRLRNTGSIPAKVLTSYYQLSGVKVLPPVRRRPGSPSSKELEDALIQRAGALSSYSRYSSISEAELIQFGQITSDQTRFAPGEELTANLVANLPHGEFDSLRLTTDVVVARAAELEVGTNAAVTRTLKEISGRRWVVGTWPISKLSAIDSITDSDREIVASWLVMGLHGDPEAGLPRYPLLNVFIQHQGHLEKNLVDENRAGLERGLERRYGMSLARSVSELSLRE
jgi:hypothetical protein